jgi:hypothetical protein
MSDDDDSLMADQTDAIRDRTEELSSALTHSGENKTKQWFLLTGSRLLVTGVLLAFVFFALLGLSFLNPIGMRNLLNETNAAKTLFSSLLSGAILLVSIVVSINSIVLSQEITDIESQQERISASIEYRRHIEDFIEADVTPARPAEFLNTVMYAISGQMEAVVRMAKDSGNQALQEQVDEFADQVAGEIRQARKTLANARLGAFTVLLVGLNYNYSGQLHAARTLKREFSDELDEEQLSALDNLIETFKHMATGREYFKSLYYKRELARLSSLLLYVSLPVIVFTSYVILALDARLFPEISVFGLSPLLISVIFAYTVALAPYIVLTAFIVRATTITLRTLAAGPFILQTGGDIDMYDWEDPDDSREWDLTDRLDDE